MSNQSVIKYKSSFKKSELVQTKPKTTNPKEEEACVTFDTGGIEILLYVIEDFQLVMESLNVTSNDNLDKFFKKILGHGPSEKWKRLNKKNTYVDTVVQQPHPTIPGQFVPVVTVMGFEKAIQGFIATYCTSQDPKGDLIEYLKSDHCMKHRDKSVAEHQDRMEELMRYSTRLEGSRTDLSESEQKLILFGSFPVAWQINWKRTQNRIQNSTVEDMMIYMNQEKEISDSTSRHRPNDHGGRFGRGRGRDGGRGRGRGRGRGGREDRRQGRGDFELKRCTQHQGQHLWKECPENRRSDAYKRVNGRGRGRGRGRDQGRGYEQSYHTQHQAYQHLPPPPGVNSLPPPPVQQVSVGPGEAHYYAQYGGSQPHSVAPTYASTYMSNVSPLQTQQQPEFYMASDGHYYKK